MTRSTRRPLALLTSASLAGALALGVPSTAEAAVRPIFAGSAYGSTASVGSLATSGRTSAVSLCTAAVPSVKTATAAAVLVPGVVRVGAVTTRVASSKSTSGVASTTTTSTGSISMLSSLITASAVTTTAKSKRNINGTYTLSGSSLLEGLRIAGRAVDTTPGKNTDITIKGVATVRLNAQSTSTADGAQAQNVTALRVTLLPNNTLKLPAGTIVVGSASASLARPVNFQAYGSAYGTQVNVGSTVTSGPTAAVGLPCGGSNGATRTNNTAAVNLGPVLKVGATQTTAKSTDTATNTVSTTTATTGAVNLLGGIVTLDAVTAKASTTRKGATVTSSTSGTQVVGLKIRGVSRTVSSAENSSVDIAGVGTLHLRRAVRTSTGVTVYAAQLTLSTAQLGLAAGTTLNVGVAQAGVYA